MGILIDYDLCEGCGKCVPKCSHHALKMDGDTLVVNNRLCTECAMCIDFCPNEAMDLENNVVGDFLIREERDEFVENSEVKRVHINEDNPCIVRLEGCDNCNGCVRTCKIRVRKEQDPDCQLCLGCGQCIHTCPEKVLQPKNDMGKVLSALQGGKTCIAYTAPGTRVALGDEFGEKPGENVENKLVSALRAMGFRYVLDLNFAADVTIMEESSELIHRLKNGGTLPMITSCCPAWVRYCELFYPDLLDNLSTCKSPMGMEGALINSYFLPAQGLAEDAVFTVAVTPCTAKKGEITRPEITGTDAVITIQELGQYIRGNLNYSSLPEGRFDSFMGEGSGAGAIFGNSGGVMEAALRTASHLLSEKELLPESCAALHGMEDFKELTLEIGGTTLRTAVINGMSNAVPVLDSIRDGSCQYDFIEIMNCSGGCIGGGGQPRLAEEDEFYVKKRRIDSIYAKDEAAPCRAAHLNPEVQKLYQNHLGAPCSEEAHRLLHTVYQDRSMEVKGLSS